MLLAYQVAPARARTCRMRWLAWVTGMTIAACEGTYIGAPDCGAIAEGGCVDKGDSVDQCFDYRCQALYQCVQNASNPNVGAWELRRECPYQAPPTIDAPDAAPDADAESREVSLPDDLPPGAFGGPGCVSLQLPDCSLATGYGCQRACCGCEELYVCENGGWVPWGSCEGDVPTKL